MVGQEIGTYLKLWLGYLIGKKQHTTRREDRTNTRQ